MNTPEHYDVVVFGAGVSGVPAALAAARCGVRVLLVEKTGLTGGTVTNAAVAAPAMFNAWGRQIIGGIGWELVANTLREEGKPLPDFTSLDAHDHVGSAVWINPLLFACLCDEALQKDGVELLLHSMPTNLTPTADGWQIALVTKEGIRTVTASQVVDCTGDGDVARLAEAPFQPYEECQPGTLSFCISGFNPETVDYDALGAALKEAQENGELQPGDVWWCGEHLPDSPESLAGMWRFFLGRGGMNANHVSQPDPDRPGARTAFELAGRASVLRVWRFLKRQPGFENVSFALRSSECGCRESRRIDSLQDVTAEDYRNGVRFPEMVCYSFYPLDLHDDHCGLSVERLREGVFPTVPRGALVPREVRNLVVAGRLVGSDRLANSALRIQATCMATGQAAGALAALAAQQHKTPAEVDYALLRQTLLAQGTIL
jgi:hypothetical protein